MAVARLVALVSVIGLTACTGGTAEPPTSEVTTPPTTSEPAPSSPPEAPPTCAAPLVIDPRELSARWPALLGQRVRFAGRIERSLGVAESVVVARGERFVVVLAPDQGWSGTAPQSFTVLGAKPVQLGGAVVLPWLVLDNEGTCNP